ncbi:MULTISPECIES: hypothetical protein [Desulfococcus]|uniref:Uncharacterized protein n=1 Tax=Desulfococcus multivorans DSM 2059 TaxID=1121405 RepID=S7VDZ1_DESML|nr:hypothetical protein [Desulfococcus multivorans]AOY59145.1 conserved uncharacterized protein [Desulfococcus multivorans]AQV01377.1 hypothetical protein B2D07_11840 [Desulfococcus multivorans]EPR44954.1 hypothetical protein dsmv_0990 [Desulfococcus multivorans DSM 2059]MDX9818199.1 hypothetical protein [Desulfococcus multivorans]SJZ84349.1 hypothetical protein SAMN02745446_01834 [Desulfococcus multivorans DSM 2059]
MINQKKSIASLLKEHKTVFVIIAVVLFLIELEIFAVAAMNSGRKAWLQIIDGNGNVIHETDGKSLSDFNKYYFEKTFGPLDQYEKKLEVRDQPFPFRAWFTAAVGIPIGVILLFAFVVKAYVSLFYGEEAARSKSANDKIGRYETEFEKIVATISSFNIFTIGFLLLLAVFMYWVLPNMVTYIGRVSVDTLVRFKWVFIAAGTVVVGLFVWIIYLRYLLAKRSIDNQAELEKARLQLEYRGGSAPQARLVYEAQPVEDPQPAVRKESFEEDSKQTTASPKPGDPPEDQREAVVDSTGMTSA